MNRLPQAERKVVTIVGTGSWGTTLAIMLAGKGLAVTVATLTEEEAFELVTRRENRLFLPGFPIPPEVTFTASLSEALAGSQLLILAVPSQTMRENVQRVCPFLTSETAILSAAKGIEIGTLQRMSEVIQSEIPVDLHHNVCALSGPNLSREIASGKPATTVVAGKDNAVTVRVRDLLRTSRFRVYTNEDIIGVELGGSLKNIVAVGAGIADGLGAGDNAKAALVTRGLAEMARLGVAAGADQQTFAGLAGLGDLVATCASPISRNHYLGQELAKGRSLAEIQASMGHVAEGVSTTIAACELAQRYQVEMPIAEKMHEVLFEGLSPTQAMEDLMLREAKQEF
jgi:glycerol-3-phosphate dehydrogenase (NAD(P)+)